MRLKSVNLRDLITSLTLLTVALVWIVLVYRTIEPSQGPEAGSRAFPLFFGIVLAVLSLAMFAQTLMSAGESALEDDEADQPGDGLEIWCVGGTVVLTIIYGAVMEQLGFIVATVLFVAAVMVVLLRIRQPIFVLAMSVGLSLGSYVIFGKLLGTYLPPGTWIGVYF